MKSFIRLALPMSLAILAFAALRAKAPDAPQAAPTVDQAPSSTVPGVEKICGELLQKAHEDDLYVTCFPSDKETEWRKGRAQGYKNSVALLRLAVKLHPEDFAKKP